MTAHPIHFTTAKRRLNWRLLLVLAANFAAWVLIAATVWALHR